MKIYTIDIYLPLLENIISDPFPGTNSKEYMYTIQIKSLSL